MDSVLQDIAKTAWQFLNGLITEHELSVQVIDILDKANILNEENNPLTQGNK